jgi:plasmid stabilization system protein ParE
MRFAAEAERGLTELLAHPLRWPEHLKNTRRYRFPGFPYALIYRATRARLRVIAVPHDHQAPGYWQRRR